MTTDGGFEGPGGPDDPDGEDSRHGEVAALFRVLASPVRVAIVDLLHEAPRCVHELVDELELPQPLVSQHLRVLRTQHVVARARRGREAVYSLANSHVSGIVRAALAHATEPRPVEDTVVMLGGHEHDPGEHYPGDLG